MDNDVRPCGILTTRNCFQGYFDISTKIPLGPCGVIICPNSRSSDATTSFFVYGPLVCEIWSRETGGSVRRMHVLATGDDDDDEHDWDDDPGCVTVAAAFSSDHRHVYTLTGDSVLHTYDFSTGEHLRKRALGVGAEDLTVGPNGLIIVARENGQLILLDESTFEPRCTVTMMTASGTPVRCAGWREFAGYKIVVACSDEVHLVDLNSAVFHDRDDAGGVVEITATRSIDIGGVLMLDAVDAMSLSPDGRMLAVSISPMHKMGALLVFDLETGERLGAFLDARGRTLSDIAAVKFLSPTILAAAETDNIISVWNVPLGKCVDEKKIDAAAVLYNSCARITVLQGEGTFVVSLFDNGDPNYYVVSMDAHKLF